MNRQGVLGLICSRCEFQNKAESKFCIKCGEKLEVVKPFSKGGGFFAQSSFLQGRYQIIKQLGRGGMGVVYLADDRRFSNRLCVVKEMSESLMTEGNEERTKALMRFNTEADLLAKLSHPNVPQVYDRFYEKNKHYLVMEFVAGLDLRALLDLHQKKYNSPLLEKDVVVFLYELCQTLEYLHNQVPQILHRDIKPENIMLTQLGKIKLVDFGIAKLIQTQHAGTSIGTQGYAAPEQYRGQVESRTDIYALGATFHHLLSGRDPQRETPFDYPLVETLNHALNPALSHLIDHMLQNQLDNRPQNVRVIISTLKNIYPKVEQWILNYPNQEGPLIGLVCERMAKNQVVLRERVCTYCGYENKPESKFCIKCGTVIETKTL
jgi:serine/threonine protein kinase